MLICRYTDVYPIKKHHQPHQTLRFKPFPPTRCGRVKKACVFQFTWPPPAWQEGGFEAPFIQTTSSSDQQQWLLLLYLENPLPPSREVRHGPTPPTSMVSNHLLGRCWNRPKTSKDNEKTGPWGSPGLSVLNHSLSFDPSCFVGDHAVERVGLDFRCQILGTLVDPHMEGSGISYGGVWDLKSLGLEGPRAVGLP